CSSTVRARISLPSKLSRPIIAIARIPNPGLFLRQHHVRPAEVDAVVLRIRPREVRARVMLDRGRAAEERGQRRLRPGGNYDAETAAGAEDRAVHVVGAIADGEFSRSDVVE